jgi:hypothetical protein
LPPDGNTASRSCCFSILTKICSYSSDPLWRLRRETIVTPPGNRIPAHQGPTHSSDVTLKVSYRGGSRLVSGHIVWDLWCTQSVTGADLLRVLGFPSNSHSISFSIYTNHPMGLHSRSIKPKIRP